MYQLIPPVRKEFHDMITFGRPVLIIVGVQPMSRTPWCLDAADA